MWLLGILFSVLALSGEGRLCCKMDGSNLMAIMLVGVWLYILFFFYYKCIHFLIRLRVREKNIPLKIQQYLFNQFLIEKVLVCLLFNVPAKACFTLILRPFVRAFLPLSTERKVRSHTISHRIKERKTAVRCSYDYLTSHARLPQDGHAKVTRLSQDKTIRRTVPALQPCGYSAIFIYSRTFRSILVAALR